MFLSPDILQLIIYLKEMASCWGVSAPTFDAATFCHFLPLNNIFKIILIVQCLVIGWNVSLSQPLRPQSNYHRPAFIHYFTFILLVDRSSIMCPPGLQCCSKHLSGWGHRLKDWSASCYQNNNKPGLMLPQWPLLCCCLISSLWS